MRDWHEWDGSYTTNVYDKNYIDLIGLAFDSKKAELTVENVTLDEKGIMNLRKKLQQVERYLKDNRPPSPDEIMVVHTEADGLNEGEELQ